MRCVLLVAVLLIITALAVLAAVVAVATGRGGNLIWFAPDRPAVRLPTKRPIAGTDVALLNLPSGLWGYQHWEVDETLYRLAHTLAERDTRIAVLEQRLAERPSPADVRHAQEARAGTPDHGTGDEPPPSDDRGSWDGAAGGTAPGDHGDPERAEQDEAHRQSRPAELRPPNLREERGWAAAGPDEEGGR